MRARSGAAALAYWLTTGERARHLACSSGGATSRRSPPFPSKGTKGPHPREYHEEVVRQLTEAMGGCKGPGQCPTALLRVLSELAQELTTPGTYLRKLITKDSEV